MKTVRLTLRHDAETIHPMHRFVAERDAFDSYRMVHGNFTGSEEYAFIFHVVADAGAAAEYEAALESVDGIRSFEVRRVGDRSFTVYVRDVPDDVGTQLLETFSRGSLVPLPPLEYRSDWTVRFSVVGESDDLRRALEGIPDGIEATVERVGEYDGSDAAVAALTDRQREALCVAREMGYFAVPREASVEDVAAELGCSAGTAAEHLRKAEAAVIGELDLSLTDR
ncbi:helix-turn-helix domain-containing protein [Halopiger goleimassiliensis]|uniref:helix-turn-helix domain-containing protein n=1 Tax=Halopiger goleimassiliensis TaxID=1293048 RepID=UPI000677B1C8|nr:helix-turn-helix domain-containing protein [Halopiger goleimassiliensis]